MSRVAVDYAPLQQRPSPLEVERLWAEVAAGSFGEPSRDWARQTRGRSNVAAALVGGVLGFVVVVTGIVQLAQGGGDDVWVVGAALVLVAVLVVVIRFLTGRSEGRSRRRFTQLAGFARANGFDVEAAGRPHRRGSVTHGSQRHLVVTDRVTWQVDGTTAVVEHAHRASSGTVANSTSSRYLAVHVGTRVPQLVVRVRGLRAGFRPGDHGVVAVEGENHQLLAGRTQHEAARLFLTDELVSLLTDADGAAHAEVDEQGWFVAHLRGTDPTDVERWKHCIALADAAVRAAHRVRSAG